MTDPHSRLRRQSRRMALCGLLAALSAVILCLGSLLPLATFACPLLAAACLLPVLCEYGGKTALLLYAAVSCLALLLCADREAALLYVFLGWYPVLRPRLCRLPRLLGVLVKCALFCLAVSVMYGLILYLFRLEAVAAEFAGYSAAMLAGLLGLGCAVFLLFDRALASLTLLCRRKRPART